MYILYRQGVMEIYANWGGLKTKPIGRPSAGNPKH